MGESRPPLRAAFWAISAALLLTLLATLSDPYRVRQSLVAQGNPVRPSADVTPLPSKHAPPDPRDRPLPPDQIRNDRPTPSEDTGTSPDSAVIARETAVPDPPAEKAPFTVGARMHAVSSGDADGRGPIARAARRPAMPILAPGELTGAPETGRFEELPPPPELAARRESIDDPLTVADADLERETELALERLQLETELLTLRHDLTQSIESRQIEQIQHLQQQQGVLLERQQQTAERLERLADQLTTQSARIERFFEQQADVTPPPATSGVIPDATMRDAAASVPGGVSGEPHFEQTTGGRQRLSLVIESDDVTGILERLGRWASATALEQAAPPVTRSTFAEPRYLAPPPAHADPTPLSDLERPPQEFVSPGLVAPPTGPAIGGPLFAAPAICH